MLPKHVRKTALWVSVSVATLWLSACGQAPVTLLPGQVEPSSPPADAAQKRAARALSVGNVATVAAKADPFQRALVCAVAVQSLALRLDQSQMLDGAQSAAVERVARFYMDQSEALGAEQGKADQEYDSAKLTEATRQRDPGLAAQTAIGCLRNAAEAIG